MLCKSFWRQRVGGLEHTLNHLETLSVCMAALWRHLVGELGPTLVILETCVWGLEPRLSLLEDNQCGTDYQTGTLETPSRRPPGQRKIPGSNPACAGTLSGSSHTSDLNIGTPVATLPGAWHYRVSAETDLPGVSILWLGEIESLIRNFYLSVAARKIVCADPSLRYTSMLLGRSATKKEEDPQCVVHSVNWIDSKTANVRLVFLEIFSVWVRAYTEPFLRQQRTL